MKFYISEAISDNVYTGQIKQSSSFDIEPQQFEQYMEDIQKYAEQWKRKSELRSVVLPERLSEEPVVETRYVKRKYKRSEDNIRFTVKDVISIGAACYGVAIANTGIPINEDLVHKSMEEAGRIMKLWVENEKYNF